MVVMAVGRALRTLRAKSEVSMNKVHLETRMSTSYLSKLERDEFVPGEDNLRRIVDALKKLDVEGADELFEEHRAVEREREALVEVQRRLAGIQDREERLRMLDDFVETLDAVGG
jgi:transcriptional regulator with XRE-family HTH domain